MGSYVETIIVGGGQAGLSASWYLNNAGREHVILDRGEIGDTWRNRWDSFCLVTPNWCCKLPGFPYDGEDPDGFMLRDEIVDYIERYAQSFAPPYCSGVDVSRIEEATGNGRFRLETSDGEYFSQNLIIATGTHQHPNIPAFDRKFPEWLTSLHSAQYRNAHELDDGAVLIVGSGQSGCQLAEDLLIEGRKVHLCVGKAGRVPRRYRGHDNLEWDEITGFFDLAVGDHPKGEQVRFLPHPHLSGRDGGHTIDLRQLALDGVELHGKLIDVDGDIVRFADDLADSLSFADEFCHQNAKEIDQHISRTGMDAPPPDLVSVNWTPPVSDECLDFRETGITTIIYATGFRRDFRWISLPVFDETGYPRYERGVTDIPGLYFVGLHWMHTLGSGLFYGVGRDAGYVVEHLLQGENS